MLVFLYIMRSTLTADVLWAVKSFGTSWSAFAFPLPACLRSAWDGWQPCLFVSRSSLILWSSNTALACAVCGSQDENRQGRT